jgi:ATP-binding cassette, subfamily B, bacterial
MSDAAPASRALPRILALVRPHVGRVWTLGAVIVAGAGLAVAAPLTIKLVFDRALFPAGGEVETGTLVVLVGVMAAIIAGSSVVAILQTYLGTAMGELVVHDLRDRLYRHLQQMSLRFFAGTQTGEIQSRVSHDVEEVGKLVSQSAVALVANSFLLAAGMAAMVFLAWQLALVMVVMLPLFVYISRRVGNLRRALVTETQETQAQLTSMAEETLSVSGALLAKIFHRHPEAVERYEASSRRLADLRIRQELAGRVSIGVFQTFVLLGPAIVYLIAGLVLSDNAEAFTPGTLVAFTALQLRLFQPMRELVETSVQLRAGGAIFDRIFAYLDMPHEVADSPRAQDVPVERIRGEVSFDQVSFSYDAEPGADEWGLRGIDLHVRPGQLAALVGPTGAGKTTLTYLLARLYDVDAGAVRIDGLDVRDIRQASLAQIVAMVTQETYLLHASVRDNLLYARPEATSAQIERAARLALLHDWIRALPDGYDTIVGERGARLSGGEKQRLAIARAILRDARVLILDEATSALDTASERLVQRALEPLMTQRTTLAIAHRLSTVQAADVIFVLDSGRIVERGTHDELTADGGLYAHLHREQFATRDPVLARSARDA